MPSTLKQKRLARLTLENPHLNTKRELVALSGYGRAVQENPSRALESKGYKEELAKFGLTEKLVSKSLVSDIKAKPRRRKPELELAANILGMTKQEKPNVNVLVIGKILDSLESPRVSLLEDGSRRSPLGLSAK